MTRAAAIFGATGLIGRHCLEGLIADPAYGRVVPIGRSEPPTQHEKLNAIVCPIDTFGALTVEVTGAVDDVFCCLGTTQAKAKSAAAFQAVDRDAVIAACEFALRARARHFLLVSAVGASPASLILYNRTKGEAEAGCRALADRIRVSIFRPSLLLGERSEFRLKEKVGEPFMRLLSPVMIGPLAKLKPIAGAAVARAMIAAAKQAPATPGVTLYEGMELARLGGA